MNHAPPEPAHSGVADRHVPIDRITRRVANPVLSSAIRLGWGPKGARILTVTGRRSGLERHSIVIPTEIAGSRHLVAPRGATDWVRNLRASGAARLRIGSRREEIEVLELDDEQKAPVLRRYLENNRALVAGILGDLDADSPETDLASAGTGIPIFRIR